MTHHPNTPASSTDLAVEWLRNNYQDYPNIASLCDALREALAASRNEAAPQTFDAFLCRAWGETDLASAELLDDWEGVRRFMVREWLGKEDEEVLLQLRDDFDHHEEEHNGRGGAYEIEFEIGVVSVERVCGFASRTEQAAPSVASGVEKEWTEVDLWAEIHRLRAAVKGPDGYASWQEAATAERVRRVKAERALAAPGAAIAAREQEITKADVLFRAKLIGLVGWVSDCGQWFEFTEVQQPSELLIQFAKHYAALASRQEAPAASASPATVAQPVEWGDPKTVGMFVRQLQTIAPETPIHAAVHTDLDGKRVALTKPVTISRERVQGRHIRQGDQSVPYSIVVWASHDEDAQPCHSQGCGGDGGEAVRRVSADEDKILRSAALDSSVLVAHGRAVEVCPECDIADCRHIRERRRAALSSLEHVGKESTR